LNVNVAPDCVRVDYIRSFLSKDETDQRKNGSTAFSYIIRKSSDPTQQVNKESSQTISAILSRPSTNSITFDILSKINSEVAILYGPTSNKYMFQTKVNAVKANTPLELTIGSLKVDNQYFYTIQYKNESQTQTINTPEDTFHTARLTGKTFTFDIQADPHLDEQSDATTYKQTLQNVGSDKPDFLIDLGDMSMTEKLQVKNDENIKNRYLLNRSYYDPICQSVPCRFSLQISI